MKKYVLAVLAFLAFAGMAFAAEEEKKKEDSYTLDPIVVTASRIPEEELGYSESLLRLSKSVSVISRADVERAGTRNVPELLKTQVGLNVQDFIGNGKTAQVDIRGFGETGLSNTLVLINGRRVNQIDTSGVDWSQIDIDAIERIEIVRGPQSVLYGDNAVGGVINIITKRGKGVTPEMGFDYTTGSYHFNSYSGYASGGSPFLDYFIGMSTSSTDGYRHNSGLENIDFNSAFTVKPTDFMNIRFDNGYHRDWYGQPGLLTDAQIERYGMRATRKPDDRGKTEDFYFMPGFDMSLGDAQNSLTFASDFIMRGRRTASLFDYTAYWYEINNHIKTYGVTPKVVLEFPVFGMPSRTVFGVDYYNYKDEILSTDYTNQVAGDGRQKDRIIITEQTVGLYATESIDITSNLTANGGFRYELAGYEFDQEAILLSENTKRQYEYAFDGGINYRYNERSAVYGTVARSFRLPAVDEWYQSYLMMPWGTVTGGMNLDLVPQTGMHYEIGIRDNSLKFLKVDADYFLTDLRHELFFDPWVAFVNAVYDRTIRHGLELETHVFPAKELDIYARYTYEKAFFVGSHYAGKEIPMVPKHKASWGINYTFMKCVDLNYIFNFVGQRYFISDQYNTMRRMKYFITNDIRLSYHKFGVEVFGALNNMFDYRYSDLGSYGQYYPSNGRNFLIGAKYKF